MTPQKISIVTPCFNEEMNVFDVYSQVREIMVMMSLQYGVEGIEMTYEHLFIDNCSTDRTVEILRGISAKDRNVKVLVNSRNFGHIRSGHYALLSASGDAVILMPADLQDPPMMIPEFIRIWKTGFDVVMGIKAKSKENMLMFAVRKIYYYVVKLLSDEVPQVMNFSGYGLYDKKVIAALREIKDPYPYLRGLIGEIGFSRYGLPYEQNKRKRGKSKNNFYVLYDFAMLGIVSQSKILARLMMIAAIASMVSGIVFKSLLLGVSAVQLFFMGILGEYIINIYSFSKNRPMVFIKEKINFE